MYAHGVWAQSLTNVATTVQGLQAVYWAVSQALQLFEVHARHERSPAGRSLDAKLSHASHTPTHPPVRGCCETYDHTRLNQLGADNDPG